MLEQRLIVYGTAALLLGLTGCARQAPVAEQTGTQQEPTVEVSAVSPQKKALIHVVEQPGMIHSFEEARLYARIPGHVGKVLCDIGQKVEPGQLLVELEVPELVEEGQQKEAEVGQARAEHEQAIKQLAAAEAAVTAQQAVVGEARAVRQRWESESRRMTELAGRGLVDAQTRDETRSQYEAARARLLASEAAVRKAEADRDRARADVAAALARIKVAEAAARRQQALLAFARIRAPFAGIITRRNVHPGDLVHPGSAKAEPLLTVARFDPVRVVVMVPEADAGLIRDKATIRLSIPAVPGGPRDATITRTSWALDHGSHTLRVEVDLPNPEGRYRPGMYLQARISNDLAETWVLPTAALSRQGETWSCFRLDNGKAIRTPVQVGRSDGTWTEVPRWQSDTWHEWTGQETVAARAIGLSDGQTVRVTKDAAAK